MEKLPDNIKRIDVLRVEYGKKKLCTCLNPHFSIDYQNKLVYCTDCGAIVDPFETLKYLANHYDRIGDQVESLLEKRRQIANYKPHMVVFRNLEQSYRKGKYGRMLPRCPKCGEVFYFEEINEWASENFYKPKIEKEEN